MNEKEPAVVGVPYVDYLMPGIFMQTVAFGAINTGVGLAEDMSTGMVERFRALPMSRVAVLAGRALSDLARNLFVVLLMVAIGFLVDFRIHTNALLLIAAIGMMIGFGFALSWLFAFIGMSVANAESAQAASFPILLPLTFASSAFVPLDTMPGWLQAFARNQPVSVTVDAVRRLMIGGPTSHAVIKAVIWIIAIIGTTIAPWQLFFQQSYLIDKRITPRFMNYERTDLWIGIAILAETGLSFLGFGIQPPDAAEQTAQFVIQLAPRQRGFDAVDARDAGRADAFDRGRDVPVEPRRGGTHIGAEAHHHAHLVGIDLEGEGVEADETGEHHHDQEHERSG